MPAVPSSPPSRLPIPITNPTASEDTMAPPPLGIKRIDSLHYYVRDLDRSRRLFTEKLDFTEVGVSTPELEAQGKQRSAVFQAGEATFVFSEPLGKGGRAWRFLNKHPEGVGTIVFEVEDADRAFALIEERGGTAIDEVATFEDATGSMKTFSITTPFGDTTFRFVERSGYRNLYPGFRRHVVPKGGINRHGIGVVDHITSNFPTMKPALLWMEHVLGFEPYWGVEFHTSDIDPSAATGSGLKSTVMWDRHSGVKFANNEPARPFFRASQINVFAEEHRGAGVQHVALATADIQSAVSALRDQGVQFMPTPGTYYDALPERIKALGIGRIDEDIEMLRELEILVDGEGDGSYLLQIFLKEGSDLHNDPEAGPFFLELIQRKGDDGFGAGNFRALFESIERAQRADGRV
jgi:4-hydroxyphenylpyruvate dioxygenase